MKHARLEAVAADQLRPVNAVLACALVGHAWRVQVANARVDHDPTGGPPRSLQNFDVDRERSPGQRIDHDELAACGEHARDSPWGAAIVRERAGGDPDDVVTVLTP